MTSITEAQDGRAFRDAIEAHREAGFEMARTVTTVPVGCRASVDARDLPRPKHGCRSTMRLDWFKKTWTPENFLPLCAEDNLGKGATHAGPY